MSIKGVTLTCIAVCSIFVSAGFAATFDYNFLQNVKHHNFQPRILEDTINASVECVRGVLNDGLPEFGIPSLNPLVLSDVSIDLDQWNLDGVSGTIEIKDGILENVASFVMTQIHNSFVLIPPTFTVDFGLHYDTVEASTQYYKANVTIKDVNFWGEGSLLNGVEDLNVQGHLKAVVQTDGVHMQEFDAPITIGKANFAITGAYNDEEYSQKISQELSQALKEIVNGHPEIFSDILGPFLIDLFNALVNDDAGAGIIKSIIQTCIIDIVFPPGE